MPTSWCSAKQRFRKAWAAAALACIGPCLAQTGTVAIEPVADAALYEQAGGWLANGGGQHLFVGLTMGNSTRRSLIRFDIAQAVPQGARITSVTLSLNVSRSIYHSTLPLNLHRVVNDWSEGGAQALGPEGTGALASAGDVTWLHRSFPYLHWTTPGGDYEANPLSSGLSSVNGRVLWHSTEPLVACVQSWLDHPASNHGWLIRSDEAVPRAVRRLDSREHRAPAARPTLHIGFQPPGTWIVAGPGCDSPRPTLTLSGTLTQGGHIAFHVQSLPHSYASILLSLGLSQNPWEVKAGCHLFLEQSSLTTMQLVQLDAAGQHTTTLPIPALADLNGLPLSAQSAILDPGWPLGFALTNATLAVLF